jgi:hypothetical protein
MMKFMKSIVAALFLTTSTVACAGSQTGTIAALYVRAEDGLVYFVLNGPAIASGPACASHGYWILKDENSISGKRQYALLLAAQLSAKAITVNGFNTCTRWVDGEDVNQITLAQ